MSRKRAEETALWDHHRSLLELLYVRNGKSLKDVMATMATDHNFERNKAQYEKRFRDWGYRKNLKAAEGEAISRAVQHRQGKGKTSVVNVIGFSGMLHERKVERAIRRYGHQTTFERHVQDMAGPRTPPVTSGCSVLSPPALDPGVISFSNLPWIRFTALTQNQNSSTFTSPWNTFARGIRQLHRKGSHDFSLVLTMPSDHFHHVLTTVDQMPDEVATESKVDADSISNLTDKSVFLELMKLFVYSLSNNIELGHVTEVLFSLLKRDSGFRVLSRLLQHKQPTIEAMAEKLLVLAVNADEEDLVGFLLGNGVDPNAKCLFRKTSLQIAARRGKDKILRLLLSHGAKAHVNEPESLLEEASLGGHIECIKTLLEYGNCPGFENDACGDLTRYIIMAARYHHSSALKYLLDYGEGNSQVLSAGMDDVLEVAAGDGDYELVKSLISRGVHMNGNTTNRSCYYALHRAVLRGHNDVARLLCRHGAMMRGGNQARLQMLRVAIGCSVSVTATLDKIAILFDSCPELGGDIAKDQSPLRHAARCGSLDIVKFLLDRGAKANMSTTADEVSLLASSVLGGNIAVVTLLLGHGATEENDTVPHSRTALQAAIERNRTDIAAVLLSYGHLVTAPAAHWGGVSALSAALESRNLGLVNLCLEAGSSVNIPLKHSLTRSDSPLQVCARQFDIIHLKRLVQLGADPVDLGALFEAAVANKTEMFQYLRRQILSKPPSLSEGYISHLISKAVADDQAAILLVLEEIGVDFTDSDRKLKVTDSCNWIDAGILSLSVHHSSLKILRELRLRGVDMNKAWWSSANTFSGYGESGGKMLSAICFVSDYKSHQSLDVLHLLIEGGARLDGSVINFNVGSVPLLGTALWEAITQRNMDAVNLLIDSGADVNLAPNHIWGRTPLQAAVEFNNVELVKKLLAMGAEVNAEAAFCRGATALQFAAIKGNFAMFRILLADGADVNAPGSIISGRTALEGAAEHGHLDMVQHLLDLGARVDGDGVGQYRRAVQLARVEGHMALARMLEVFKQRIDPTDWRVNDTEDLLDRTDLDDLEDCCDSFGCSCQTDLDDLEDCCDGFGCSCQTLSSYVEGGSSLGGRTLQEHTLCCPKYEWPQG